MEPIRLNKYLSTILGLSRREADNLIANKKVTVNDQLATLSQRINSTDQIKVDNQVVANNFEEQLIAVNKPIGVTCSRRHQKGDKTIYDILPKQFVKLKTVGRLDKNSSGLILLSNNGDFIYRMTHPKFRKIKIYKIRLNKSLEPLHQQMINDFGIELEDGKSQLILEKLDENRADWQVTMHEGRNRQIRRTFRALGYEVIKLHRIQFGDYQIGQLKSGQYQPLINQLNSSK